MRKLRVAAFLPLFFAAFMVHAGNGAASKGELQTRYLQFFQQKDETRLGALVYWRGVEKENRDGFLRSLREDFKYHLRDIQFLPLQGDEHLEYTLKGVTYVPALPPVGRMIVTYEVRESAKDLSTSYLIGANQGRYYIDLAVKKTH